MSSSGFSIVIPAFNEAGRLPQLLADIKRQSLQPEEIIVADANSTDATQEIAQAAGARVVEGGLPSKGRNSGIGASKSERFFLFDADCRIPNDFLERCNKEFLRRRLDFGTVRYRPEMRKFKYIVLFASLNAYTRMSPWLLPVAIGICMIVTRKAWLQLGGFDERPSLLCEDAEFAQRIVKAGLRYRVLRSASAIACVRRFEQNGYWHTVGQITRCTLKRMVRGSYGNDGISYWDHDPECEEVGVDEERP